MAFGKSLKLSKIKVEPAKVELFQGKNRRQRRAEAAQNQQYEVKIGTNKRTGKTILRYIKRTGSKIQKLLSNKG